MEPWRVGLYFLVCLARAISQLENTACLDRLEHAVKVEWHPFSTEHVVQTLRVRTAVFDLEHQAKDPGGGRAELVCLGFVPRTVRRLFEAANDDGGVVLGESSHFGCVNVLDEQVLAGAGGRVRGQDHATGVQGVRDDGGIFPGDQGTEVLVAVVTGPAVLVYEIVRLVGVEFGAVTGAHGAVQVEGDGAVPRCGEYRAGGGQGANGQLILPRGGMDGQANVVWEVLADGVGKGLAPLEHLLGDVLDARLETLVALALFGGVNVLEVRLEELDISPISQTSILALGDFAGRVPVLSAVAVDQGRAIFGGVGDVGEFCEFQVCVDVGELVEAGEGDLGELLFEAHSSEGLAVGPHIFVWNTEQVFLNVQLSAAVWLNWETELA